jgi:hypothetical protein
MPKDFGYIGMAVSACLFFGAASKVAILRPLALKFFGFVITLLLCFGLFLYLGKLYNPAVAWLGAIGLFAVGFMLLGAV